MKNDETKKYHPTEDEVAAARTALRNGDSDEFWKAVAKELDALEPEVQPRRLRE